MSHDKYYNYDYSLNTLPKTLRYIHFPHAFDNTDFSLNLFLKIKADKAL